MSQNGFFPFMSSIDFPVKSAVTFREMSVSLYLSDKCRLSVGDSLRRPSSWIRVWRTPRWNCRLSEQSRCHHPLPACRWSLRLYTRRPVLYSHIYIGCIRKRQYSFDIRFGIVIFIVEPFQFQIEVCRTEFLFVIKQFAHIQVGTGDISRIGTVLLFDQCSS